MKKLSSRRSRGGRPRSTGAREPSGRLRRGTKEQPAAPLEALGQRADVIAKLRAPGDDRPTLSHAALMGEKAGSALGMLLLAGRIDDRQYEGGVAFAALWRRWAAMAQCPPRTSLNGEGSSGSSELDPGRWHRTRDEFEDVRDDIRRSCEVGGLAMSIVETVLMDDVIPPRFLWPEPWPVGWHALRSALDAAADHFIPKDEAVKRPVKARAWSAEVGAAA